MAYIEVNNLKKIYKVINKKKGFLSSIRSFVNPEYKQISAVNNIGFQIEKGESVGFIGPNGAGKSTTVKMLSGILVPTSGTINIGGLIPYKDRKRYTKNIGVVIGQRTQLWWDLPVSDTFELLKYIYRIDEKVYQANIGMFSELLALNEFINQPVRQLSLGQRMRADIAGALLHNPEIIFFDEPTIGLDLTAKEKVREFIKYVNKEKKTTILFTSHDLPDIEKTCNRMIIIDKGILIYDGSIDFLKQKIGKQRSLIVYFNKEYKDISITDVKTDDKSGYEKHFIFDRDKIKVQELISLLTTQYDVADLTIKDPDIEDIIREIYKRGV
jgi:ABC-2 type transport system ATP-binding protein